MVIGKRRNVFRVFFSGWERGLREGGYVGQFFHGGFIMGKRNSMKGAQDFLAFFKKNMQQIFSTGCKEQH